MNVIQRGTLDSRLQLKSFQSSLKIFLQNISFIWIYMITPYRGSVHDTWIQDITSTFALLGTQKFPISP